MPDSSFHRKAALVTAVLGLLLAGCGSEQAPTAATQRAPSAGNTNSLAHADLDDTAVTGMKLTTSSEYDSATKEVRVFALVKDQEGNPLTDFNAHNFVLTLNAVSAPYSVDPEDVSFSVEASSDRVIALVIDSSGSMAATASEAGETRLDVAKQAAKFFVNLMDEADRAAIVTFSSVARTVQPLTGDKALLTAAIDSLILEGATNIGDAVQEGVAAVGTRPGRRAMILLTDGDDTMDPVGGGPSTWLGNTSSTRYQGLRAALGSEFSVFTVGLGTDLSEQGLGDLQTIADRTGGEFFEAPQASDLLLAFQHTIPAAVDRLDPIETYVLAAPSPGRSLPGQPQELPYRLSARYVNGNSAPYPLVADSTGTYYVP